MTQLDFWNQRSRVLRSNSRLLNPRWTETIGAIKESVMTEYEPIDIDDKNRGFKAPFPYGVICKTHGLQEISRDDYEDGRYNQKWVCPICEKDSRLDSNNTWGRKSLGFRATVNLSVTKSQRFKKWGSVESFCEAMEAKLKEVNEIADGEIWTTVDIVYETRWDCPMARLAAA